MTSHEDMLRRMSGANPLPDVEMITDGQLAEMTLRIEGVRRSELTTEQPQRLVPTRQRVPWRRPAIAFAAAMLTAAAVVGVVSLTTGDESQVTDPTSTTATFDVAPDEWNPVLATVFAGPAREATTCPPGTDPSQPGPQSQERPAAGSTGQLRAAFDIHTGRVLYVDRAGATWAFDVCANTWIDLRPGGSPTGNLSEWLIYDVDSDVTVSIEADEIFVYDSASNTWENRVNTDNPDIGPTGAAYDPVSGLIITASQQPDDSNLDAWSVQAYDVDTNSWHDLGTVPLPRQSPCCTGIDLLGYSVELDRLILTTYVEDQEATLLLDPRTGEMSTHIVPTPIVNLGWPSRSYGQGDTVYVHADDQVANGRWNDVLCGFDADEIAWSRCYVAPDHFPALSHNAFDAVVGDPVNNRVLLLGGTYNNFSSDPPGTNDVWAIDLETGEWTEVLAPSGFLEPSESGAWDSLLATARSQIPPEPATCPEGVDPDTPGPATQPRPLPGSPDDHDATFDLRTGRIMHVDGAGETWAFDVCTNTWLQLNSSGEPVDRSLVYDVDSDVTIALGPGDFSVYDAGTNTWTRPPVEVVGGPAPNYFAGVAYDPVSGLVITSSGRAIWAYDVDSNQLARIGAVPEGVIALAGYLPDIDRLVIAVAWSDPILIDPRTGMRSPAPDELPFLTRYDYHDGKGAAAVDTINDRLVVIGSYSGDDVWGIDMDTSDLTELLAPSE